MLVSSYASFSIGSNAVRGDTYGTTAALMALAVAMVRDGFLDSEPIITHDGEVGPMSATRDTLLAMFEKDESFKVTLADGDERSVITSATIRAAILAADWSGDGAIVADGRRRSLASIIAVVAFNTDIRPATLAMSFASDEDARDFALRSNTAKEATLLLDREQKWLQLLHKREVGVFAEKATAIQRLLGTSYGVAQTLESLLVLHIHGCEVTTDIVKKGRKVLAESAKLAKAGDTSAASDKLSEVPNNTAKVMSGADIRAAHDVATGIVATVLGYIVGNAPESLLAFAKAEADKAGKAKADKAGKAKADK